MSRTLAERVPRSSRAVPTVLLMVLTTNMALDLLETLVGRDGGHTGCAMRVVDEEMKRGI